MGVESEEKVSTRAVWEKKGLRQGLQQAGISSVTQMTPQDIGGSSHGLVPSVLALPSGILGQETNQKSPGEHS